MENPIRVLVVDDEEELVSTMVERLEIRGYAPTGVISGEEALRFVETQPFDVVVLDLKMPGIDGVEVMKRIKKINPSLPVILLTGHMSMEESDHCFQAGAIDYVIKPINIEDLIGKMKEAIALYQGSRKNEP